MSTTIPLAKIFDFGNLNLKQYKLHVARYNGEVEPLDDYVVDPKKWYGWNTFTDGANRDIFSRKYIFAMMDFYPKKSENVWLFGGIFTVIGRDPKDDSRYITKMQTEYSGFEGRLQIQTAGKLPRTRALNMEKHMDTMVVYKILKQRYAG